MKRIRNIFLAASAALLAFSANGQAPAYAPQTILSDARFAVGMTNITPIFIDVRKQKEVLLTATTQGTAAVTNIFTFGRSVDGTTFTTNGPGDVITWAAESLSTLATTRGTNINMGGAGYLVLFGCHATLINTNTLKYGIKISAP